MISKKVCGIFLASSVAVSMLLTSCSQPGNKRSGASASADEEGTGEDDAKPKPKTPAPKTPQVTINGDCNTATGSPAGVPAPSPDAGTAAPGTANLKLALVDGAGTTGADSQLGAPPVVAAVRHRTVIAYQTTLPLRQQQQANHPLEIHRQWHHSRPWYPQL